MYISRHQQILHYISNDNILVGLTINNHTTSLVHVYDAFQINKTIPYIYTLMCTTNIPGYIKYNYWADTELLHVHVIIFSNSEELV